ncbi:NDMA-dependent alcohol dehydrogenase [Amycolatopsis sp. FU40]|uniref:NDMA-dependent alcohol dehydrogenase n=1 Tax=Amycolatopsis sp. FU40 TaxID=2914159 RepID=UPI001F00941F|nr:NDMA-dependent alcohol dehydrogenase [Amycolatopsis sp. FU40]UKD57674.1 NDMA-dependent alcohol dehydrogenase [Amycolatopsis sp. FU40]
MKTLAAVVDENSTEFELRTLEVDEPGVGEVHVKFVASGLCHSDFHMIDGVGEGKQPVLGGRKPIVVGHEGAGIVESVGPAVTRVKPGDHVVCSFQPSCGVCRYCATGRASLCDWGALSMDGAFPDGRFRYHGEDGRDYGSIAMLGTFSQRATMSERSVVKIDDWLPLESAVLVGCGVPTGWGTATSAGSVRVGDTVVVYGIGGIGINAVQGAAYAGAKYLVVVDPVEFKRETALKFGATHAFASPEEAAEKVRELTWGQGADQALVTVGVVHEKVVQDAFDVVGKGGVVVVTGLGRPDELTVHVSGAVLTKWEKTIKGSMFGTLNPHYDIVKLLRLYDAGKLKLDELATRHYRLEEINQGYADMVNGEIIRGVILHDQ